MERDLQISIPGGERHVRAQALLLTLMRVENEEPWSWPSKQVPFMMIGVFEGFVWDLNERSCFCAHLC